jgi:hypothetical protein
MGDDAENLSRLEDLIRAAQEALEKRIGPYGMHVCEDQIVHVAKRKHGA